MISLEFWLHDIFLYVSRSLWPCRPSLTSGSQWQKQFAIKTPPPRFKRNERNIFFIFFLSFFNSLGSVVSMLVKSNLWALKKSIFYWRWSLTFLSTFWEEIQREGLMLQWNRLQVSLLSKSPFYKNLKRIRLHVGDAIIVQWVTVQWGSCKRAICHIYIAYKVKQSSSNRKSAVSVIFLHSKQQKAFQGTLGTLDLTSIGSKTSLGPSMDPTGPLNWTLWFLRKFRAVFTNYTFFIL